MDSRIKIPNLELTILGWDPEDPEIVNATVLDGGGEDVIIMGPTPLSSDATISGITITGGGRGIFCSETSASIRHCVIKGNTDSGLYCYDASPSVTNCIISENTATRHGGGGVYCISQPSPIFANCTITENFVPGDGGGLFVSGSASMQNCIVSRNTASELGGGLYCYFGNTALMNCTITENRASEAGGGLYNRRGAPILTNCIFWGDFPREFDVEEDSLSVTYSDIQGGWAGEGNISRDPALVEWLGFESMPNPIDRWIGDTFTPRSSCIDAGDPSITDGISDSHPNWPNWYPNGTRSDMGAYGGPGNGGWLGGQFLSRQP